MLFDNARIVVDRNFLQSQHIDHSLATRTFGLVMFRGTFFYMGQIMYCFTTITCLHTMRNTMANKKDCARAVAISYVYLGIFFVAIACSFYSAYGNESHYQTVWDIYSTHNNIFFFVLNWLFFVTFAFYIPLFIIAISEQVEF